MTSFDMLRTLFVVMSCSVGILDKMFAFRTSTHMYQAPLLDSKLVHA